MITPGVDDRADNWHWKAARTDPAGYADDEWLTGVLSDPEDRESASHGDAKSEGGCSNNEGESGGPSMMQNPGIAPSAGPHALLAAEAVPIDFKSILTCRTLVF